MYLQMLPETGTYHLCPHPDGRRHCVVIERDDGTAQISVTDGHPTMEVWSDQYFYVSVERAVAELRAWLEDRGGEGRPENHVTASVGDNLTHMSQAEWEATVRRTADIPALATSGR